MLKYVCEVNIVSKYFRVIDTYPLEGLDNVAEVTTHYTERGNRVSNMRDKIRPHTAFIVDKHHENGLEIHVVYSDATIKIFNYRTKRLITVLYGRVPQVIRYYVGVDLSVPYDILCKAQENEDTGRNNL